ncbi:MAG TPA: hypothetical protein VEX17_03710, partial [Bacillales bacterium]|nr:hypothetical protein [Bacillales bacterium]
ILSPKPHHVGKPSSHFHSKLIERLKNAKTKAEALQIIKEMHEKHMRVKGNKYVFKIECN